VTNGLLLGIIHEGGGVDGRKETLSEMEIPSHFETTFPFLHVEIIDRTYYLHTMGEIFKNLDRKKLGFPSNPPINGQCVSKSSFVGIRTESDIDVFFN
jgi:hypothetical protein